MSVLWRTEHGGALGRIVIDKPKGNVIDGLTIRALRERVAALAAEPALKAVVIEGAGRHFSFGASVEDHLPGYVEDMLPSFHALFRELEDVGIPTAALVRGQCLGGGAELATWCGTVFCNPESHFGFPEVRLGVFPPLAAAGLWWRTGGAAATRLVMSGRSVDSAEAVRLGLADVCAPDPEAAVQAWFAEDLAPSSAFALRQAWRVVRAPLRSVLDEALPAAERRYLGELMAHPDPLEGLTAFLDKRPPRWGAP